MDLTRRNRLIERRRMMQIRQHRQALSGRFRRVARRLCAQGVRLSKSTPQANHRSLGPLAAGPGQDEELHFDWMYNASVANWSTEAEAADLVRVALAACARPDELTSVIWHSLEAGLRLKARDLAAHAELILDHADWTTWIVAAHPAPWLVQIGLRSQTVAFSPNVPVRTDSLHRGYGNIET